MYCAYKNIASISRVYELIVASAERPLPTLGIWYGTQIDASAMCCRDLFFRR